MGSLKKMKMKQEGNDGAERARQRYFGGGLGLVGSTPLHFTLLYSTQPTLGMPDQVMSCHVTLYMHTPIGLWWCSELGRKGERFHPHSITPVLISTYPE